MILSKIRAQKDEGLAQVIAQVEDSHSTCFYCSEPLTFPAIEWMGSPEMICLHPDCATRLCIRIFRDVHEIQQKTEDGEQL